MAAKMAVYYIKYKKIFPGLANSKDLHVKMLILLILQLQTSSL